MNSCYIILKMNKRSNNKRNNFQISIAIRNVSDYNEIKIKRLQNEEERKCQKFSNGSEYHC